MGITTLPGIGRMPYPAYPNGIESSNPTSPFVVIDATGEKLAFIGRFWSPDYEAKTIDSISVQVGTVVSAGGSVVRISLQDVSLTTAPGQPDGTQDQYRDVTLSTWSSTTWVTTGLLTNDGTDTGVKRTINHGDLIAVVFEFQSWVSADSLQVQGNNASKVVQGANLTLYTTVWTNQNVSPSFIFTCSDATLATLYGALPRKFDNNATYNLNSTPDEYGSRFIAPVEMLVDGVSGLLRIGSGIADFELILYQGTTALQTIVVDASTAGISGFYRLNYLPFATKQRLTKGVEYIIAVRPTTTNGVVATLSTVADAGHFALWPGGEGNYLVTRTDQGAWSTTLTQNWTHLAVCVTDIDLGALLTHPGTSGGMRG